MRPVNLIPQDQRRRAPRQGSGKTAYVFVGALALLLVMVLGYVLTANTVTERQNEADAARAEADQLDRRIDAVALRLQHALRFQPERDIVPDRSPRKQSRILKHHDA